MITKGLIALLIRVLNDQPPQDIVGAKLEFVDEIGLRKHLSPNRSNGLTAMIGKMRSHAAVLGGIKEITA
jgi:cysteine desulfuration protein SufE